MNAAGFWCTVVGLVVEVLGLGFVAAGIRQRVATYRRQAVYGKASARWGPWTSSSRGKAVGEAPPNVEQRVARLERRLERHETATAAAIEQVRSDLTDQADERYYELRKRLGEAEIGVRRLGLGDVRGDWVGLALASAGIMLSLVGAVLSQVGG
jgi:hypothetical protein